MKSPMSNTLRLALEEHAKVCRAIDWTQYGQSQLALSYPELLALDWRGVALRGDIYSDDVITSFDHNVFYLHVFGYLFYYLKKDISYELNSVSHYLRVLGGRDESLHGQLMVEADIVRGMITNNVKNSIADIMSSLHIKWLSEVYGSPLSDFSVVNLEEIDINIERLSELSMIYMKNTQV